MPNTPNRLAVERIHWLDVFPVLRLGSAFRHALQPGKLIVALLAVLAIHFSGSLLDWLWADVFDVGVEEQRIYETIVHLQANELDAMVQSALDLDHGIGEQQGVFDSLIAVLWDTPRWAFANHPWFMLLFSADALFVLLLSSGIICRMSASQVCQGKLTAMPRAMKFVARRWLWFLLTPLLPIAFGLLLACLLMLAGLVFFNLPVLDVVGSLLYGLLMLVGFVIVMIGFVLIFAILLMPPAMAVEGTDAFDAIARTFNYVLYKPWQFAGYLAGSVLYLAVVYVFVAMLAGWTDYATRSIVDVGGFAELSEVSGERVDAITLGHPNMDDAGAMVETSHWLVTRWGELLGALLLAVMFSVLCSLQTQVYVLMRRCADGAPLEDCAEDDEKDLWSSPKDMVDPAAQEFAASGPKGHPEPDGERPATAEDATPDDSGEETSNE